MKQYDVIIIGGGVVGTALLYILSNYTNIRNIALIEKCSNLGTVNSNKKNNSQTLHFGDIETNYDLEKAKIIKASAELVKGYLEKYDKKEKISSKYPRMVLAVGDKEVESLEKRYKKFKKLYPTLKKLEKKEIKRIEPSITNERDNRTKLLALYEKRGYAVDYQKLSESFVKNSLNKGKKIDLFLNEQVNKIKKQGDYIVITNKNKILTKTVVVSAGAYSLLFAKKLGYKTNLSILPVAGNFYFTKNILNSKVYTCQVPKLPFAAVHGDPEVHNKNITRFGPTAKAMPFLERDNYKSLFTYLIEFGLKTPTIYTALNILREKDILFYIIKNILFDIPFIGKRLFIKHTKKMVPSIKLKDLKPAKGFGGIRPQIINLSERKLQLGESKIIGKNIIFNITPSPGASVCLGNAQKDTEKIVEFLGKNFQFNKKKFIKDHS